MKRVYKINKALRMALIAVAALLLAQLLLSLASGENFERIILLILFVITSGVSLEASKRELVFSEDGLVIRRFFRVKNFSWAEITHLGIMLMRSKAYFLLTTTRGFYIFSNLLSDHAGLVRSVADQLGPDKVEPEIRNYLEHPIERKAIIVLMWVAVLILLAILVTKVLKLF